MIFTGRLRWYQTCDEHGLRSTPRLQQEYYYPCDYGTDTVEMQWQDLELVEEKVKRS